MSTTLPPMGAEDYHVLAGSAVHVMRFMGRNDDGHRWWRIACGCRISEETWGGVGYTPSAVEIERYGFRVCGNCARTKAPA